MASLSYILRRPTSEYGVWGWLTTVDHKKIGTLYMVTALFFFLVGGIEAIMMRAQLATPDCVSYTHLTLPPAPDV